jgi:hypothetical protein
MYNPFISFFLHVIIGALKNILITPFKFIELHHQQLICDVETFEIITCAYKYGIFLYILTKNKRGVNSSKFFFSFN